MPTALTLVLCDQQPALIRAWRREFAAHPDVEVRLRDLLDVEADAYVSPANSLGIMDGGIDAELAARFPGVERRVQEAISELGGVLPVGEALVVETDDYEVPYLVCAPTMQAPSNVSHTSNAFRAMAALLRAVEEFNAANDGPIEVVAVPGLCTGVGAMAPDDAAMQMARAYGDWAER